jgi:formylmethanofuran dehydrogenase subunit B
LNPPTNDQLSERTVQDATCAGCACVCDDIHLVVRDNRIVEATRACSLGQTWFLGGADIDRPTCLIAGKPASLADAIERAAQLLAAARYPLVYGLDRASCEAVRLAVGIADWIGGLVDTGSGSSGGFGGASFHAVGEVTCSLGEIANRADLVVVWRANPVVTHPRHFSRYSLEPRGRFVPGGRADRTCIVIDELRTETADAADQFLSLRVGADFEALWILRALVAGIKLQAADVLSATGIALDVWQGVCERMKRARLAVFLFDDRLTDAPAGHVQADALWGLVRDLNAHTRAAAAPLAAFSNSVGAANVLSWRTGAPSAVNLARGFPRFNPGQYSAEQVLSRKEADAVLLVGADPAKSLSPTAQRHLAATARVTIGPHATTSDPGAAVSLTTAECGREAAGTIFRTDGVPLPLRSVLKSDLPGDVQILTLLESRTKELCAQKKQPIAS